MCCDLIALVDPEVVVLRGPNQRFEYTLSTMAMIIVALVPQLWEPKIMARYFRK